MKISAEKINSFEWRAFEEFCYLIYKARNEYDVVLNDLGADGGADIIFKDKYSDHNVAILQCKSYSKTIIGVNLVRELLGSMQEFKVQKGLFLTTSNYSQAAKEFSKKHNITLFKTSDILDIYNKLPIFDKNRIANKILSSDYQTASCVNCGIKMLPTVSKSGKNIWKCPKCKHSLLARQQSNKKNSSNQTPQHILNQFIGLLGFKKQKLKILGFCLFILMFFVFLFVFPKFVSNRFNSNAEHQYVAPIKRSSIQKESPSISPPDLDTKTVEEIKYLYMVHFANGTNEVIDEYSISGNNFTYRKGSMNISLSKNDIKSIQRIKVK